jgi:hypothetical protein
MGGVEFTRGRLVPAAIGTVPYGHATRVALAGNGSEKLKWIARDSGPFDDLSPWSDSSLIQDWAGNADLTMKGVFFTPLAMGQYTGNGGLARSMLNGWRTSCGSAETARW